MSVAKKFSRSRRFFPRTLAECIEPLTRPALKKQGVEAALVLHWEQLIGAELAQVSSPGKIRFPKGERCDGTLTVLVDPAHALAWQYAAPLVLEKLAVFYGYRAVSRIQLKQTLAPPARQQQAVPEGNAQMAEAFARLANDILQS